YSHLRTPGGGRGSRFRYCHAGTRRRWLMLRWLRRLSYSSLSVSCCSDSKGTLRLNSIHRRGVLRACLYAASLAGCLPLTAQAQAASDAAYPERSIRMIVPFPAGGATDVVARVIAQQAGAELGQQIVVEN